MYVKKEDFKVIGKYLKPYKKHVWITFVFVVFQNIIQLLSPLLYGKAIDIVVEEKKLTDTVIALMVLWIVFDLMSAWFKRIKDRRASKIGYKASQDLLTQSVRHLVTLPLAFHKTKKVGEIIQKFTRADGYLYNFIENGLFQVVPDIITSCLAFVIIIWINGYLAILYLIFVLAYIAVAVKKTEPIIKYQKKANMLFEKIYGDIFDRVPNIIAIKSNSMEEVEDRRSVDSFDKGYHLNNTQVSLWQKSSMWKDWIFATGFFVLFVAGMYSVSLDKITIGQLVIVLTYINLFSQSIYSLGSNYKKFREGTVTINRSEKIFDEIAEEYDNPEAIALKNAVGNVEFQNVYFSYENDEILKDISFRVEAGQMAAIVGKSGEGKSTLVDLISRYNIPQKGKITLDGTDIQTVKLKSLRDQIAIVPQEIDLFNDTIKNNIAYSRVGAGDEDIEKAAKLAHCHEFISKFPNKYDQIVGEKGVKLSTGQKQRVAIARAILRNPKILILDEATSALDSESEKYVQEALEEVMKGRTTFVIAHRLSTIRKANLILVIEDGRIVESGDHQELINHGGVYKKLSELQKVSV